MAEDVFEALENLLKSAGPASAFDFLIARYRENKEYRALFEARLMRRRFELGLPIYQLRDLSALAPAVQTLYGESVTEVAREVGERFLSDGDIVNAWPYLRASGDTPRVAAAMEVLESAEEIPDALIQIAFQEGVHPVKGLQWILQKYGICQAISALGVSTVEKDREACVGLLARNVHREIVERMSNAIEQQEGGRPTETSISELISGREWLFAGYNNYVDTSHLVSILQYCPDLTDRELLALFADLCEYGKHLSPQFHMQGQPPFEDIYADFGHYAAALLGDNLEAHLDHFRRKLAASDPQRVGTLPAQLLVKLLASVDRPREALSVALEHFPDIPANELNCPSPLELCQLADDFATMKQLSRSRGDLLSYTAALSLADSQAAGANSHSDPSEP